MLMIGRDHGKLIHEVGELSMSEIAFYAANYRLENERAEKEAAKNKAAANANKGKRK